MEDMEKMELLEMIRALSEEKERYKRLWERECEAYKDLAIRTGNWDTGAWNISHKKHLL